MTRLSRRHPRYESLRRRQELADAFRSGLVVPEGLIAQGRGEAFDYLLGERSGPTARGAERAAARWIAAARRPVLSVNGNVAGLEADRIARLARAVPGLRVEVNLFHRTPARAKAIAERLRKAGLSEVLGVRPTARIPGLPSDRALVDARGISVADLCIIPLEDGDRAEALHRLGRKIVSIDLNPLSRTSRTADLPIVDELGRALQGILDSLPRNGARTPSGRFPPFDRRRALEGALREILDRLSRIRPARSPGRPPRGGPRGSRGTASPTRRTPRPSSRRRRSRR